MFMFPCSTKKWTEKWSTIVPNCFWYFMEKQTSSNSWDWRTATKISKAWCYTTKTSKWKTGSQQKDFFHWLNSLMKWIYHENIHLNYRTIQLLSSDSYLTEMLLLVCLTWSHSLEHHFPIIYPPSFCSNLNAISPLHVTAGTFLQFPPKTTQLI